MSIKPKNIYKLILKKDINLYNKKIDYPKNVVDIHGRIWYIKNLIRYKTQPDEKGEKIKYKNLNKSFLKDLLLYKKNINNDIILKCYNELMILYKEYKKMNIPFANYKSRNLLYLFTTPRISNQIESNDYKLLLRYKINYVLKKIKDYPVLKDTINLYGIKIAKIIKKILKNKISIIDIYNKLGVFIIRYKPNTGIWLHIDNVKRKSALLFNISISKEKFYYLDMVPILAKGTSYRFKINNGDIILLKNQLRYNYAHGIPYNINKYEKYTICFRYSLPDSLGYSKFYNKQLNYEYIKI